MNGIFLLAVQKLDTISATPPRPSAQITISSLLRRYVFTNGYKAKPMMPVGRKAMAIFLRISMSRNRRQ